MDQREYKKLLGARILSEANDLKRTVGALAQELELDERHLRRVVNGDADKEEIFAVINKIGDYYPIDGSDLCLLEDDCEYGVRIMSGDESRKTSRVFCRRTSRGDQTPYYEYRDTAMSKLGPFKPEWIKELRVVDDSNPENPEVVYNNGHSLHQATFFIGPVNFYWEINGQKFCAEMNTGASNYITPYWPHSFASRDRDQLALIIAVTFGGDVRRAQKEIYALGERGIPNYLVEYRDTARATTQLIRQQLDDACMTPEILRAKVSDVGLDVDRLLDERQAKSFAELELVANCLNIQVSELLLPPYRPDEEVVVRHRRLTERYNYPNNEAKRYEIHQLAGTSKMSRLKGMDVHVLADSADLTSAFVTSLHSYLYNYGQTAVQMVWEFSGSIYERTLDPADSAYIQPFVRHAFARLSDERGELCVFRTSGAVTTGVQKELSYYSNAERTIRETKCWFDS